MSYAQFANGLSLLLSSRVEESDGVFMAAAEDAETALTRAGAVSARESLRLRREAARFCFGGSLVSVVRALISFDDADRDEAIARLQRCQTHVAAGSPSSSWFGGWGGGAPQQEVSERDEASVERLELELIGADASLFVAVMQLTNERMSARVAGALALRRAYKVYLRASGFLDKRHHLDPDSPSEAESENRTSPKWSTSTRATLDEDETCVFYDASPDEESSLGGESGCGALISFAKASTTLDQVRGSVQLGMGLFRLVFSLIPPKIQTLAAAMMGGSIAADHSQDRVNGLRSLRRCVEGGSVRAPVAGLALLGFHSAMLIFARGISEDADSEEAEFVLELCLRQYIDSPLFRFFEGRLRRSRSRLEDARVSYLAAELSSPWVVRPLQHLCMYERGWCALLMGKPSEACTLFCVLARESPWSPAFYGYLAAVSALEHVQRLICLYPSRGAEDQRLVSDWLTRAMGLFQAIPDCVRYLKKRAIPVDAFALLRANRVLKVARALSYSFDAGSRAQTPAERKILALAIVSPGLELLYFWNCLFQTDDARRADVLSDLDVVVTEAEHIAESSATAHLFSPDERVNLAAMHRLVRGALLRESGELSKAIEELARVPKGGSEKLEDFAAFESGLAKLAVGNASDAVREWSAIGDSNDHPFEGRLKFKIRSALKKAMEDMKKREKQKEGR